MKNGNFQKSCIITPNYPDPWFIEQGAFVERLVREWKKEGMTVDVVAPKKFVNKFRSFFKQKHKTDKLAGDKILCPSYVSVSNKKVLNVDLKEISLSNFNKSALKSLKGLDTPDFFYGQFLESGGSAALTAGKKYNRPAFADVGESVLVKSGSEEEKKKLKRLVSSLDGLVCVSEELAEEVTNLGADPEKVMFHPNTVSLDRFKKLDRSTCRRKLGLPDDEIISIFVGHFIERKGPLRVLKALKMQNNPKVKSIFIGRGEQEPESDIVLQKGPVPNDELNAWFCAADFFVLPTLHEGYCNAINEAMASGLPIISSDIPEVKTQVPEAAGLLVDPADIDSIAKAIEKLASNPELRKKMGEAAFQEQVKRSSRSRASIILEWINLLLEQKEVKL